MIPDFVIQGGAVTPDLMIKEMMAPIVNEHGNGLTNVRGSIAMARTDDPDSATSQYFINLVDNDALDEGDGYAVFGAIVEGMDVVDAIAQVQTASIQGFDDMPVDPVIVTKTTRL